MSNVLNPMSNVLKMSPPLPEPEPEAPSCRRVRRVSRAFTLLLTVLLVLTAAATVAAVAAILFYPGDNLAIGPTSAKIGTGRPPPGYVTFASLTWPHRLAYALAVAVRWAPAVAVLWNLRALFGLYARGVVFARENARHLQWIGVWLIVHAAAPLVCHLFLSATGFEIDRRWAHFSSLQALVLGGLVIVIAQVMQVGREIEEERSQFV